MTWIEFLDKHADGIAFMIGFIVTVVMYRRFKG
jgi:hypothetical protein